MRRGGRPAPRRTAATLATAALSLLALSVLVLATSCSSTDATASDSARSGERPPPIARAQAKPVETTTTTAAPATTIPGPQLPAAPYEVATPVTAKLEIFDAPNAATARTSLDHPTLVSDVPVDLILLVLATSPDGRWHQVLLPVRPNGSTGWVRSSDVRTVEHDWRIVVSLSEFRLEVFQGDQRVLEAPIAVARDNAPTPGGLFYTTTLLQPLTSNGPYGPYAYVLSGFSDTFESFDGGPGSLGIHGTNDPSSIGTKASSGCIRLRNADIEMLAGKLPLGVPVEIRA